MLDGTVTINGEEYHLARSPRPGRVNAELVIAFLQLRHPDIQRVVLVRR